MSSVVPDAQVSSKRAAVAAAKQPDAHSGLPWEPAVSEAVLGFAHGDARIVQMGINAATETVILHGTPETLSICEEQPPYTLFAMDGGAVFIYYCPDSTPVREKMLHSLNRISIAKNCMRYGIAVVKGLESSDASEINEGWIKASLSK